MVYLFGNFVLNDEEFTLTWEGSRVPLEPKALRVLLVLIRSKGRLVTKQTLLETVWSGTFVEESTLTRAIALLRKQLGDDRRQPRFIETVPTLGYRFIAPVEEGAEAVSVTTEAGRAAAENASRPSPDRMAEELPQAGRKWPVLLSGALVALAVISTWVVVRVANRTQSPRRSTTPLRHEAPKARLAPIVTLTGQVGDPAISPDGREVAYFWEPELRRDNDQRLGKTDLYVQLTAGGDPLQLTHTKTGFIANAAWSPDGGTIAFGRCDDDGGGVFIISALGGPERKLMDLVCPYGDAADPNWTRDGKSLVLVDRCAPGEPAGIVAFSVETGLKRCLSSPPRGNEGDINPVLSPDGRTVAWIRMISSEVMDLYTVPLVGGTPSRLTYDNTGLYADMWTPDSRAIVFSSTRNGMQANWRIPAEGGAPQPETVYPGVGSLSRDGSRLVWEGPAGFESSTSIWRFDISPANRSVVRRRKLLATTSFDGAAQPSPDNRQIVFESARSGSDEIWRAGSDGSETLRLTSFNRHAGTPRWSPDGRWIAFDYRPGDHSEIWIMDNEGRNPRQVVSGNHENVAPGWSSDGKGVLFASNRTGRYEVWRHDLGTRQETQITKNGGFAPAASSDGGQIFFSKFDGAGIWSIPAIGGREKRLTVAPHLGYWGHFAATQDGIYLLDTDARKGPTIEFYALKSQRTTSVVTIPEGYSTIAWTANLGASRDGSAVYLVLATNKSSIMMADFAP